MIFIARENAMAQIAAGVSLRPVGGPAHPILPVGLSRDPWRRLGERVAAHAVTPSRANELATEHEVTP